jgi:hypothetical protein
VSAAISASSAALAERGTPLFIGCPFASPTCECLASARSVFPQKRRLRSHRTRALNTYCVGCEWLVPGPQLRTWARVTALVTRNPARVTRLAGIVR